jgi:murein DD-endopeptidase MepM/ murein hydrolase activator NlpD
MSKTLVREGQFVKKGEVIGEVGTTGRSTGPHLHWGVQWFSKRVDPAKLLKMKFN